MPTTLRQQPIVFDVGHYRTPRRYGFFPGFSLKKSIKAFLETKNDEYFEEPDDADVTSSIEDTIYCLREIGIVVPNASDIREYLTFHFDIAGILSDVCIAVKSKFNKETQLALELYRDNELADEYLTLFVRQVEYDDDIFEKIEEVSKEELPAFADKSGWLLITTDFDLPR